MTQPAKRTQPARNTRTLMTPEGVPLNVELAERGDRAGALMIDLAILFGSMIAVVVGVAVTTGFSGLGRFGYILILLAVFFLRNFYFMFFELKWQGQTPGKRKLGLKVIDRFGRPLTSEAIFARNMMREIEIFIPMGILLSGGATGISGWMQFFAFLWAAALVCLPLMNRDNLRAGDLVAGTLVIRAPKPLLGADMLESADEQKEDAPARYGFTTKQLGAYGIYELQALEELLRNKSVDASARRRTAGQAIIKKIGWRDPVPAHEMDGFLAAYYQALRKHLEGSLLMGKRKEDKFDT